MRFLIALSLVSIFASYSIGQQALKGLHPIRIDASHPKAYHPQIGDMVYCFLSIAVTPDTSDANLTVDLDGKSLRLLGVFSSPTLSAEGEPLFGSRRLVCLMSVVGNGKTVAKITPTNTGTTPTKPYRLTFLTRAKSDTTDPVIQSKNFRAWENLQPPAPHSFHVSGTVVVRATNYVARLEKAVPQGINPKILLLDLIVDKVGDVGGDAITDLPVQYSEKKYSEGTYTAVQVIRKGGGEGDVTIKKIEKVR